MTEQEIQTARTEWERIMAEAVKSHARELARAEWERS
jgi:hypothetical protein